MQHTLDPVAAPPSSAPAGRTERAWPQDVTALLPSPVPVQLLDADGTVCAGDPRYRFPEQERLVQMWRAMVLGRRLDLQCTALTKQGRLAVYPSSRGQDACQVAPVLAITEQDWLFPTYRESVALFTRGIEPAQVLSLLRGEAHCGYDPMAWRTAAQCTPLATQLVHAAGAAHGEARRGSGAVALAFTGDGATSEGDFHEALNFAAVFAAPVVFLVQNNRYAISVPLAKQSKAPSLAYKGIGYGIRSEQVDGNDPAALLAVLDAAVEHARSGRGPMLVEAHTYRLDAHTNADDATRYRTADEAQAWLAKDPIARLQTYLLGVGAICEQDVQDATDRAEEAATALREEMHREPQVRVDDLFEHVYATPTPQLREQQRMVHEEIAADDAGEREEGAR